MIECAIGEASRIIITTTHVCWHLVFSRSSSLPEEVYLLAEVADSSLNYDRNRKVKVYASANILEYWIIDVKRQQLLVFREQTADHYQIEQTFGMNGTIAPGAFLEIAIDLSNLLI